MAARQRLTRRRFLAGLSAGAAGAIGMPYFVPREVLAAPGRPGANDRINVCVIGVKNRGREAVAGCKSPLARLVGICDVDEEVLKQVIGGRADVKGYIDYREVLARSDIDAVAIATPDHNHAHMAVAACRAGKDVFCEKPMTLTIREGQAMIDAARRYARVFQVGNQRRSDGRIASAVERVRNGRIGKVHTVHVAVPCRRPGEGQAYSVQPVPATFHYDLWLGPAPAMPYDPARCHYSFRFVRDYSGGEMTNWGAHFFDVAQWGMGMDASGPVEIDPVAGIRNSDGIYDVFRDFKLRFTYADGARMLCNMRGGAAEIDDAEDERGRPVSRSGKTAAAAPGGGAEICWIGDKGWIDSSGQASSPSIAGDPIGPDEWHCRRAVGGHFGDWLHCIRTRENPTSPVEAGHRTASVCHLANIALDLRRKVRWDPLREEFPGDSEANQLRSRPYREPWTL